MNNLTSTEFGTFIYYIINTFTDGVHRIVSSFPRAFLYLLPVLLAPVSQIMSFPRNSLLTLLPYYIFLDVFLAPCSFSYFPTCGESLLFTAFRLLVFITPVAHVRG